MPFDMQPSQLAMNFNGTRSTLQGTVNTRQGQINLSGDADWSRSMAGANCGERQPGADYRAADGASGCVAGCGLYRHAEPVHLDGADVPWARIVVNDVPESAVGVSDEVMLDKNLKPIKQQSAGIPINSNLTFTSATTCVWSLWAESASDRRFESGAG
jgi:translocation and assembly module TamB